MRKLLICLAALLAAAPAGAEQPVVRPIADDTFGYVRLGYGAVMASPLASAPMVTLIGIRTEADDFVLDLSGLTFITPGSTFRDAGPSAVTLARIEALKLASPSATTSGYFGGGISIGTTVIVPDEYGETSRSGSGLQGELSAGVEMGRFSGRRTFVQADVGFPFYKLYRTSARFGDGVYAPSFTVSVGVGWRRGP